MHRPSCLLGFVGVVAATLLLSTAALAQDEQAPSAPVADPATQSEAPPPVASAAPPPVAAAPPPVRDTNAEAEGEAKRPKDRRAYVSISPFHLILPVVELTAEIRLHEKFSVAAIGGYGSIDPYQFSETQPPPGLRASRFTVWEIGGQLAAYPVGHFDHGMQLGAEILYTGVAGSVSSATDRATGTGTGLGVGPFVGYKYTAPIGFALSVQGGVQYITARAEARSATDSAASSEGQIAPLFNLNIGWAF